MKKIWIIALIIVLAASLTTGLAAAHEGDGCTHDVATIMALQDCVQHAVQEGHITSQAIAQSLSAKLDAAQAAVDQGQPSTAINLLYAFINQVQAQSGKAIVAEHASHLIAHAQLIIDALGG